MDKLSLSVGPSVHCPIQNKLENTFMLLCLHNIRNLPKKSNPKLDILLNLLAVISRSKSYCVSLVKDLCPVYFFLRFLLLDIQYVFRQLWHVKQVYGSLKVNQA